MSEVLHDQASYVHRLSHKSTLENMRRDKCHNTKYSWRMDRFTSNLGANILVLFIRGLSLLQLPWHLSKHSWKVNQKNIVQDVLLHRKEFISQCYPICKQQIKVSYNVHTSKSTYKFIITDCSHTNFEKWILDFCQSSQIWISNTVKYVLKLLIRSADPQSRPIGIIVFAHVVRPSPLFKI